MMPDNRAASSASVEESRTLRQVMPAMSIPLASIFGSGFLVIVPVLASSVGRIHYWQWWWWRLLLFKQVLW